VQQLKFITEEQLPLFHTLLTVVFKKNSSIYTQFGRGGYEEICFGQTQLTHNNQS